MSTKKPTTALITILAFVIGGVAYLTLSSQGYNFDPDLPQAKTSLFGFFELSPETYKWIMAIISGLAVPLLNKWIPGLGEKVANLIGYLIDILDGDENDLDAKFESSTSLDSEELQEVKADIKKCAFNTVVTSMVMAKQGNTEGVDSSLELLKELLEGLYPETDVKEVEPKKEV